MPDVNIMEHIDTETGKFSDTFKDSVTAVIGEEHKDTKLFDSIPDVATALKVLADTKSAYGKKLEGVIQKPGEKATDQEKSEYVASLRKELGASDSGDDYEMPRPEDLPEGMNFSEEAEKTFRDLFVSEGVPVSTAKLLVEKFNEIQIARFQSHLDEETKAFEESSKSLQSDWKGDDLVKNARTAHAALMEFADKDLTALIKESKIYDTAGDLAKWNSLGLSPSQLRLWYNIGDKMKSKEVVPDEGGTGEKTDKEKKTSSIYSHPSSVRDREQRAKNR